MPGRDRSKQLRYSALLFLTALIWGMCFVAQRSGMEHIGPVLFNGIRELLGAATLGVVLALMELVRRLRQRSQPAGPGSSGPSGDAARRARSAKADGGALSWRPPERQRTRRRLLLGGLACGGVLFVASNMQQVAMVSTDASKAAFITTLYIVLVPVIGIALRHKTHWNTWLAVGLAVVGLYLLCVSDDLTIAQGDAILLVSALFWALHILAVDYFVADLSLRQVLGLCTLQFLVCALASLASASLRSTRCWCPGRSALRTWARLRRSCSMPASSPPVWPLPSPPSASSTCSPRPPR